MVSNESVTKSTALVGALKPFTGIWRRFNAKIGVKLGAAFLLVLMLNVISTFLGVRSVEDLTHQAAAVSTQTLPSMIGGMNIKADMGALTQKVAALLSSENSEELKINSEKFSEAVSQTEQNIEKLRTVTSADDVATLSQSFDDFRSMIADETKTLNDYLSLKKKFHDLDAELARSYEALSVVVLPININTLFDLQTQLRDLEKEENVGDLGRHLADTSVSAINFAGTIIASANLVIANVKELSGLRSKSEIVKAYRQNAKEVGRLQSAFRGFVGTPAYENLKTPVVDFIAYSKRKDPKNMFNVKLQLVDLESVLMDAQHRSAAILEATNHEIDQLASRLVGGAEISMQKAAETGDLSVQLLIYILTGIIVISLFILVFVVRGNIVKRLSNLADATKKLAQGDTDFVVTLRGGDEIGRMASQVEIFRKTAVEKEMLAQDALTKERALRDAEEENARQQREAEIRRQEQALQQEEQAKEDRRQTLDSLASSFEKTANKVVVDVVDRANEMKQTAKVVSNASVTTQQKNMTLASAVSQGANNMKSVALATEELVSSLGQIRQFIQLSHNASSRAFNNAEKSTSIIQSLAGAVTAVNESVEQIQDIANQTHLLALNAGIEASRAGDAGRGFAVVAAEVKKLAMQTASVTTGITDRIKTIQAETSQAEYASDEILRTVEEMKEVVGKIYNATEQQNETLVSISKNVNEAATESSQIEQGVGEINNYIQDSAEKIRKTRDGAEALAEQASHLKDQLDRFLSEVRTG